MGSRSPLSGCMRFAALASCMSCRLQRDDAGSCLVGARVDFVLVQALALCNVGADRVSRPLTERVAGHAYMASHLACVKGEGKPFRCKLGED
jgi:hypothetical protein